MFKVGKKIGWKWTGRVIEGEVVEVFTSKITRKIKTATITRNATPKNPAYLVRSTAGNLALKLETELVEIKPASKSAAKRATPKMFE